MSAERILRAIEGMYQGKHQKRVRTLSVLVSALVLVGKVGVAALGRAIRTRVSPKHAIKRVDRFLSNTKIEVDEWCADLVRTVIGPRKRVKLAIDWTKIGPWPVLVASVVVQRRGIPVYWATCDLSALSRSLNAFEEGFLTRLRSMIPPDVEVTLLFDRGFRRVSLVRLLKLLGFHFVIRCCPDIWVEGEGYRGILGKMKLPRSKVVDLGEVFATKDKPEPVRVVAVYDRGQKEGWYLFTDLDIDARAVVKAYGRRFTIEEVFRDEKSTRYGWSLGEYRLKSRPDRLDRLLLVVAVAYFLVSLVGLALRNRDLDMRFKANTDKGTTHSLFQLGWKGWRLMRWLPRTWFREFSELEFEIPHGY
jgi:hypothetical protein